MIILQLPSEMDFIDNKNYYIFPNPKSSFHTPKSCNHVTPERFK